VHVVVVVLGKHLDHAPRPAQAGVRADEDEGGPGGHEAVDEILGQSAVDLRRLRGRPLEPILARVVDVHVEAVLVRRVPDAAEAGAEVAALRTREVADDDARGARVSRRVRVRHLEDDANEVVGAPAAPAAAR
jgi:hypothetical protein